MDTKEILVAVERFKQGLISVSTDGNYSNSDFNSDLAILMSEHRVAKMIPVDIQVNRTPADFRRAMQTKFQHYKDRRQYISDQLSPIYEYIHNIESGSDKFTLALSEESFGDRLGRGGFGTVYKYHHELLDMDFAVKLFDPMFVSNEENLEGEKRFFREAKILFSLNHENIVRIYDIGRYNGQPFIRMEYVEGDNMLEFVDKYGAVSFKRSKKPIIALLYGLNYAHKLGIVHRDLKPSNFMVSKSGKFKIIDFGISAFLETEGHTQLTKTGEALAGGAFTDPLLMENPKLRDVRSDIYSVGAIWYYLLVGHNPMGGDLRKNLLSSGNASELEAGIILKCMSSKLEDRYDSCQVLLDILVPSKTISLTDKIGNGKNNM